MPGLSHYILWIYDDLMDGNDDHCHDKYDDDDDEDEDDDDDPSLDDARIPPTSFPKDEVFDENRDYNDDAKTLVLLNLNWI